MPMPNVMAALPNIGGALCSTPQSLLTLTILECRELKYNAVKTRNPLKFTGVPQTCQQISAASGPKFTVLSKIVEEVLLFNMLFPIVDICLSCEDIVRQNCTMVPRWRIFGDFWVRLHFQRATCSTFQTCILNSH